ncbi:MAG: UDP-N-acetylmuramate dehydrogenase [Candidatus Paceibacterota bacterium]
MKIFKDYNLKELNTFRIEVKAKFFTEINSENDLVELFNQEEFKNNHRMFLGGGSNVLFTKDFDGIVVLNKLKGIETTREDSENVLVRSFGGELWQDLIMFVVNNGYWGIENLAFIPGTVGATPIQNIGAYGIELKDILENVETFEVGTGEKKIFSKEECELGYRDSVFKNKLKEKYFISAITLKLNKIPRPNLSYKILSDYLEKNKIKINGPKDISDAVTFIRQNKLPSPKMIGNAGSFFKNVFISKEQLNHLLKIYPNMPYFEEEKVTKIPAGWLIEQCEWKGHKAGNVGVYEKQALVLVNYGGATGSEILELANKIITSVKEKFGLELLPEVNIV